MRILLASSSSGSRGGGEIFLRYLAGGLRELGHTVGVWMSESSQMDELADHIASDGIEVLRDRYTNTYHRPLRSLSALLPSSEMGKIRKHWAAWNPDIIHINKQNLEDGLDLYKLAATSSIPAIGTLHITQSQKSLGAVAGGLRDAVARRALQKFSLPLTAVSDLRAEQLAAFSGNTVTSIYNGVPAPDTDSLAGWRVTSREALGWDENLIGFLGVGRMVPQKRPLEFIRLARSIHSLYPATRFAWIGDGELSEDWDRETEGATGWIQRLPWQQSTAPWFAAADVFLHTAAFEGLPFAVLEACSFRLPLLLPDSVIQEASPFQAARIPSSDHPENWMTEIGDPGFRSKLGETAHALFLEHFSLTSMVQGFSHLYETTLKR